MAGRKRSALAATGARADLALELRRLRDDRGMTLRQLAARSGYSAATLSMVESGRRVPSWDVLAAFVQSCGADPAEWRLLWRRAAQQETETTASQVPSPPPGSPPSQVPEPPAGGADPRPKGLRRVLAHATKTRLSLAAGGLVAAIVLGAAASHMAGQPPAKSPDASHARGVAAFVIAPESCGALRFGADGAAWPVTCPDGRPNIAAVRYYRHLALRVLGLGPRADPGQVHAAACADLATGKLTFPVEARAAELAQAEQDWHFGVGPASEIGPGLCPAHSPYSRV
jgi:transcriptional regulator with XRE-family HTH domain